MRIHSAIAALSLTACLPAGLEGADMQAEEPHWLGDVVEALQPDAALALVSELGMYLPGDGACPFLELDEDGLEIWSGGCEGGGLWIEGEVYRSDLGSRWIAGEGFHAVDEDGALVFLLDGAVEVDTLGEMLIIQAAFSTCGEPFGSCEHGVTTVDMVTTIFPWQGYPDDYDMTVEGVVVLPHHDPVTVHGAWSVDSRCPLEPVSGGMVFSDGRFHGLEFDGFRACDGCVPFSLDGLPVGRPCDPRLSP